ncbi:hypothetical protein HAX54_020493, partial [Datura stramonium]|nr:hypothetical protein [Datura stramonium]
KRLGGGGCDGCSPKIMEAVRRRREWKERGKDEGQAAAKRGSYFGGVSPKIEEQRTREIWWLRPKVKGKMERFWVVLKRSG